ncbi:MAG TPA: GNAT family N-acetyltransferase [Phycisphaerales bacterium]|nr:GNAT family N-acetyltransferase [Phycisphaerales bacterium]
MSEPITIRRAVIADAEGICAAHIASIRDVCARDYEPHEIAAWLANKTPSLYHNYIEKFDFWVATAGDRIAGFIDMHPGPREDEAEIGGLYLHPDFIGRGVGAMLMSKMLDLARARQVKHMLVFATRTARPFYERTGFRVVAPHEHIASTGVRIPSWRMEMEV